MIPDDTRHINCLEQVLVNLVVAVHPVLESPAHFYTMGIHAVVAAPRQANVL